MSRTSTIAAHLSPQHPAEPTVEKEQCLICAHRDNEYDATPHYGRTVHLKGFASRIDFADSRSAQMAMRVVQRLVELAPSRLVWDGDDFAEKAFTRLIPEIFQSLKGAVELVAFLRECDEARFRQSWEAVGLPVTLFLCPAALDWRRLGTHALEVTGSNEVICYGGGGTVAAEFEARPSAGVKFSMFAISRPTSDGLNMEHSALIEAEVDAALEVVYP